MGAGATVNKNEDEEGENESKIITYNSEKDKQPLFIKSKDESFRFIEEYQSNPLADIFGPLPPPKKKKIHQNPELEDLLSKLLNDGGKNGVTSAADLMKTLDKLDGVYEKIGVHK